MNRITKSTQREHRERVQVPGRQHLGQLEKKKDYKKRADDYNKKAKTLKTLKQKALEKNPDEFYYHMINSRIEDGVHHDQVSRKEAKKEEENSAEQQKLLDSKDLRYVLFKLDIERKKVDKLKATLHLTDPGFQQNKHTVFVDSDSEAKSFSPAEYFNTHSSLVGTSNMLRKEQLAAAPISNSTQKTDIQIANRRRAKQYEELAKRLDRLEQLRIVADKLQLAKNLASKSSAKPTKIKAGNEKRAAQYKWKFERKR